MVNVPCCRSHLLCEGVFRLDYNLCLARANEISETENEGFHCKMICFYFGYHSEWSGFRSPWVILIEKQKYFWIRKGFRRADNFWGARFHVAVSAGVIVFKWKVSNRSSDVFPTSQTLFSRLNKVDSSSCQHARCCMDKSCTFSSAFMFQLLSAEHGIHTGILTFRNKQTVKRLQ